MSTSSLRPGSTIEHLVDHTDMEIDSFIAGLLGGIGSLICTLILLVILYLCRRRRKDRRADLRSTSGQPSTTQRAWTPLSRPKPGRLHPNAVHGTSTHSATPLFASHGWRESSDPIADLRALVERPHTSTFRAQYSGRASPSSSGERFVHFAEWSESGSSRCLDIDEGESVVGKAV